MMNWLVTYPDNVIPAILYSIVYLVEDLLMRWLFISLYKESEEKRIIVREHRMQSCKIAGGGKCDGEKIQTRQIGRAWCRERVKISWVAESLKKKKERDIEYPTN